MPELIDAFRKSWQKAGDDIKIMKSENAQKIVVGESVRIREERDAWKEAFLASRAYFTNNNGENSKRRREAIACLKEMKLIK